MTLILLVFALVFLCIAAAQVSLPRFHFGWAGLALWVLAVELLPKLPL